MQDAISAVLTVMEGLSCPRSLSVSILIKAGEWDQVLDLTCDPSHYTDSESFWAAYAATELLKKCKTLPISRDRREAALKKWQEGEVRCFQTNLRLAPFVGRGVFTTLPDERIFEFIRLVRKKVFDVLGAKPPSAPAPKLGPGSTMSDRSRFVTVPDKLASSVTLTTSAWPFIVPWLGTSWGRAHLTLGLEGTIIAGNGFFTAPKNAKTDRPCAKEPSLNSAYQLAIGQHIRRLLRLRAGVDLDSGQRSQGWFAREGSINSNYATLDLSSASDTLADNLVKLFLPTSWYSYLTKLRSPYTNVDGRWHRLEKFSSMGNGFTFELESLIFWAISSAVQPRETSHDVHVYGDDIIVPTDSVRDVIWALKWCGFSLNSEKSYYAGPFRESCGQDFFQGTAVRPFYLKEFPDEPHKWIAFANGLRRMAYNDPNTTGRFGLLRLAWFRILDNIPSIIRGCRGPSRLGDLVIHDDENRWHTRERKNGIRYVRVYRPRALSRVRWEGFAYETQYSAALYLAGSGATGPIRDPNGDLVPREPVLHYKVGWLSG